MLSGCTRIGGQSLYFSLYRAEVWHEPDKRLEYHFRLSPRVTAGARIIKSNKSRRPFMRLLSPGWARGGPNIETRPTAIWLMPPGQERVWRPFWHTLRRPGHRGGLPDDGLARSKPDCWCSGRDGGLRRHRIICWWIYTWERLSANSDSAAGAAARD